MGGAGDREATDGGVIDETRSEIEVEEAVMSLCRYHEDRERNKSEVESCRSRR